MITSFYIIDQGVCIYNYNFKTANPIDQQLLSGFLSAIGTFAQATFQTALQSILIQNGLKLNFYAETDQHLTLCAISDARDSNELLQLVMQQISDQFKTEMGGLLNSGQRGNVDGYKEFDASFCKIVSGKDRQRDRKTHIKGILFGGIVLFVTFFSFIIVLQAFTENPEDFLNFMIIAVYFNSIGMGLASFLAGINAGTPKLGLKTGIYLNVGGTIFMLILVNPIGVSLLLSMPFTMIICIAMGYYGGIVTDRKFLYPLDALKA